MARPRPESVEFKVLDAGARAGPAIPITELEQVYGGPLRFPGEPRPYVFANFVSTIDGVATLEDTGKTDSVVISGGLGADRLLMAMLRAAADVVLIGAATLRATPRHQWTPGGLAPDLIDQLSAYRTACGKSGPALLAVITSSGNLPDHAALAEPAMPVLVITTDRGADRAARAAPGARVLLADGGDRIPARATLDALARATGATHVLCEGGPTLFGSLLQDGTVRELFLTLSPRIAGRAGGRRGGIVEGWTARPDALLSAALLSVRRSSDHLFLRYRLGG